MRYYKIVIDGQVAYTSHPNGNFALPDPGALLVELDIPQAPEHLPMGGTLVRVWGIGLSDIAQARDFNGKTIAVYGGMGVGLPLATLQAPNAGLLVQGKIYQAFGNWVGTEQTLDFIITADFAGPDAPANLVVQHMKGDKLGDVVKRALTTAYPNYTVNVNVLDNLVLDHPGAGFYQSLDQFARIVNDMSISIFGSGAFKSYVNYPGIQIAVAGNTITVTDGQQNQPAAKTIQFYDYVGQPTWLGFNQVQVKTILRGDINVCDRVTLANTATTTTSSSSSQLRDNSIFQGTFMVQKIRHVGNSRQPDGTSWVSIFDCVTPDSPGGEVAALTPVTTPQPTLGGGVGGIPVPNPQAGPIGSA